ncbi:MAG: hypothetical protein U0176_10230 [Bacteroidia bacterium]
MKAGFIRLWLPVALLMGALGVAGCAEDRPEWKETVRKCTCPEPERDSITGELPPWAGIRGALLATRFASLEEFKKAVRVRYGADWESPDSLRNTMVLLAHCSGGTEVTSVLSSGVSQADIQAAKDGGVPDRIAMTMGASDVVAYRKDLERVLTLARRVPLEYGEGDPAFFDLGEASVRNICTIDLAFHTSADSSEKGYLNTFNHMTAQAFITTLFSEDLADLVADLHERKNMPALTTGSFTSGQLSDVNNNPVDNYVDMINNEWGQQLGHALRDEFEIQSETTWTPELLAQYLNRLQEYYEWAFRIGMMPFRVQDPLVIRFANKLNVVLQEVSRIPAG